MPAFGRRSCSSTQHTYSFLSNGLSRAVLVPDHCPSTVQDEYHDSPGSVIAADFYHSNVLMGQTDADIVARVQRNVETCEPGFRGAKACHGNPSHIAVDGCPLIVGKSSSFVIY